MSREIGTLHFHMDEEEHALRDTSAGKILFTRLRGRMCALYLRDNRLLAARVVPENSNRIGAVYIGRVKNAVRNLDAFFVEIADGELCFLPGKEARRPILLNRPCDGRILEGDELAVQLEREAQKGKPASVTANLSLANEYAAVGVGSPRVGYSNKLTGDRKELIRGWLESAGYLRGGNFRPPAPGDASAQDGPPLSLGLVVRTGARDCSREALLQSIEALSAELPALIGAARHRTCFSCVRQAPEAFWAALESLAYPREYAEILTDDPVLYEKLCAVCSDNSPAEPAVRLHVPRSCGGLSLSVLYSLERRLDEALNARVWLKSGAYLVVESTEALTVIDVNTGKAGAGKKSRELCERINFEAAEEIALQLRLRNLSGIILVDFINMDSGESGEALLAFLRKLVNRDRIRTTVVDITPLGLVEITRKKTDKPLREQFGQGEKKWT